MTATRTRIGVVGGVFAVGLVVVAVHLWLMMVDDHEAWARRSHENRWSFKAVPSQRGALLDRFGRVLATDEPTTELALHYVRFRLRHPVGAAVHGATTWARVQGHVDPVFRYEEGPQGADAAMRTLLAMPARALRPRVLEKHVGNELAFAVTTVLSGCTGQPRSRVFAALRHAAASDGDTVVGDVLGLPRSAIVDGFHAAWQALQRVDHELDAARQARDGQPRHADDEPGLLATLEQMRVASLKGERVTWTEFAAADRAIDALRTFAQWPGAGAPWLATEVTSRVEALEEAEPYDRAQGVQVLLRWVDAQAGFDALRRATAQRHLAEVVGELLCDGEQRIGSKLEAVQTVFATQVPFDLAAELRVADERFPGIDVLPSVRRARHVPLDSSLHALLGGVQDVDRSGRKRKWVDDLVAAALPADWLAELELPDAVGLDREHLQQEGRDRFRREVLTRERRGTSGFERAFDATLLGRLGLRLVEHDARHREQRLRSHLRVEAGDDVRITIDLDLQLHAERAVHSAWQRALHGDEDDRWKVEAALAVIDAGSGDVLAYAGAPIVSPAPTDVPGVVWLGNGALGSVVKPFVLVEQVRAETLGLPHHAIASLEPCGREFRYGGTTLRCGHAHWADGADAVKALGLSCNLFFFQCALGLGEDGVARGLRRFGLAPTAGPGDPLAACWQARPRGIPAAAPAWGKSVLLPQRAIGYGVAASPLHVARAYAALATGSLPTLGLSVAPRPRVALDDVVGGIALAREGLRHCVLHGTASKLDLLHELGAEAKTGTAEVGERSENTENNAWFAGYLPPAGTERTQLCFAAVVYWVRDGTHGGDAAGELVVDFLRAVRADPETATRYLLPGEGR